MAAWTTPVVQVLSSGTAHAQTVTGCSPVITITLQATGATCRCASGVPTACCSDNSYLIDSVTLNCGPTCPGAELAGPIEFRGISKPEDCEDEVYLFVCTGDETATVPVRAPVRCGDGEIYLFDGTVTCVCQGCDLELAATPEGLVFSDETTTTQMTEAEAPSTSAESTTTTTEAAGAVYQRGVDHHDDRSAGTAVHERAESTTTTTEAAD